MLVDLEQLPQDLEVQTDVCIIGAGIAGLVLADALRGAGRSVHLLEAGGLKLEDSNQSLYMAEMAGILHRGTTEGRFRVYGGSSTRWGGQLLPFSEQDFQFRAHVPESGWPIGPADLEPYYPQVEALLGVNHQPFTAELLSNLPQPHPEVNQAGLQMRFSKWAPFKYRNVAKTLGRRCQADPHTHIFLHANVTRIQLHENGQRVDWVEAQSLRSRALKVYAHQVVICTGTIETSRLLLTSRDVQAQGIGNQYDQVGRYFHDHLSIPAARLVPTNRRVFLNRFAPWFLGATRHTLKLESTAEFQETRGSLNSMGHFEFIAPKSSGFSLLRNYLQKQQGSVDTTLPAPSLEQLPSEVLDLLYLAWKAKVRHRRWSPTRADLMLFIDCEQQPNPNSRIQISTKRDRLDVPRTVVDWHWGEPERKALQNYQFLFTKQWNDWRQGEIQWQTDFGKDSDWVSRVNDIYHPMGGTRMGQVPNRSVVDSDLRLHGVANLFIASCSVFPTGGSSNPTMTLMALTLRLAELLKSTNINSGLLRKDTEAIESRTSRKDCSLSERDVKHIGM